MLILRATYSRQATQNSLLADTERHSLGNSLTLCPGVTPFGSWVRFGALVVCDVDRREEDSERSTVYGQIQTSEETLEHLEEFVTVTGAGTG